MDMTDRIFLCTIHAIELKQIKEEYISQCDMHGFCEKPKKVMVMGQGEHFRACKLNHLRKDRSADL